MTKEDLKELQEAYTSNLAEKAMRFDMKSGETYEEYFYFKLGDSLIEVNLKYEPSYTLVDREWLLPPTAENAYVAVWDMELEQSIDLEPCADLPNSLIAWATEVTAEMLKRRL